MVTVKSSTCSITDRENVWNMVKDRKLRIIVRVKDYLKENWGAPFLVGFIVLLIGSLSEHLLSCVFGFGCWSCASTCLLF